MGTTATALQTESARYCYVLAIEGYENLLTDHYDTSAIVTAWASTGWSAALTGLKVGGPISRSIKPWADRFDVPTLSVAVQPDDNDTFGKAVFKTKPTFVTRLTGTFQPSADGSGTINVKSTAGADASGDVYIGGQKFSYSSTGPGTFTVGAAGSNKHSPFSANGTNKFSKPATHPENLNSDVGPSPKVQNVPRTWIGRNVALYVHRINGTAVDVRAQAQLEFAGRIIGFSDAENGDTVLELEDMAAAFRDAVILDNQWVGYVKEGIELQEGIQFHLREWLSFTGSETANKLTVVASGAVAPNQINAGRYTCEQICSAINDWLAAATAAADIDAEYDCAIKPGTGSGPRTVLRGTLSGITDVHLFCSSKYVLLFLGFTHEQWGGQTYRGETNHFWYVKAAAAGDDAVELVSGTAPFRAKLKPYSREHARNLDGVTVTVEAPEGQFFNQREYLPPALREHTTSGETWGVVQCGNATYLAKLATSTQLTDLSSFVGPLKYLDSDDDPDNDGLQYGSEQERLPVKQVLLLSGSFSDIFTKLIASTSGTGVNHDDYDVYPWGAGVPWSLLGDSWVNSCKALEQATNSRSITTLVTEPTRILDLLTPELAMRFAWLVWKSEGYQLRTLPSPSSLTADHTLTEANKAEPIGTTAAGRTTTVVTNEYLRNVVKLEYARDATGKYRRTLTVKDAGSIAEYGESQAKTIKAINSFGQEALVSASVDEMATSLVTRVLPVFSKPLKTMRRSIAPSLFHIAPGDTVSVTDDFARDPTTGARGISSRAGVVLSVSYDRGSEGGRLFGEVEILFVDEDRHYPMAPAAEIDTSYSGTIDGLVFTNGYAAAGPAIKLKDHAYSRSTDALDVTRFSATDEIRIFRIDGGASGDGWSRTIASRDTTDGYLTLTAALSSPAFTAAATEKYRVQFREYAACTAAQKLYAFQADDTDGRIQDLAEPNTWGEKDWSTFAEAAPTTLPYLPNALETWGDGMPLHPGLLHDAALFINNLSSYRTAPNTPFLLQSPLNTMSTSYVAMMSFPYYLGAPPPRGKVRKIKLAPTLHSDNAANTATVRIVSSTLPPQADGVNSILAYQDATTSVEFTTTSTSIAQAAEQSLVPVRSGVMTWLTIELKGSTGANSAFCYGLSRLYLGPVESY